MSRFLDGLCRWGCLGLILIASLAEREDVVGWARPLAFAVAFAVMMILFRVDERGEGTR